MNVEDLPIIDLRTSDATVMATWTNRHHTEAVLRIGPVTIYLRSDQLQQLTEPQ